MTCACQYELMQIKVIYIKYIYTVLHVYIYDRYVKHPKPDLITLCFEVEYYCLNYNEFLLFSFFHLCCKKNHPNIVNRNLKRILYRTKTLQSNLKFGSHLFLFSTNLLQIIDLFLDYTYPICQFVRVTSKKTIH